MVEFKNNIFQRGIAVLKWSFISFGVVAFVSIILSFTDIPYYAFRNLSMEEQVLSSDPEYIVVLGGSGMPSPDGLMRTYYAAQNALQYKQAKVILAHPYTSGDSLMQLHLMAHELIIRGVDSLRILFEPMGFNTHSQAENILTMLGAEKKNSALLIVSSPEHLFRAVRTFQKTGFTSVGAAPAFDTPVEENGIKDKLKTSDTRIKNLYLRYNIWSYLNYELLVAREYCAITYYKIKGWI